MPGFPTPVRRKPAGAASIAPCFAGKARGNRRGARVEAEGERRHARTAHATRSGSIADARCGAFPIDRRAAANRAADRHTARILAAMGDPAVTAFGRASRFGRRAVRKGGAASLPVPHPPQGLLRSAATSTVRQVDARSVRRRDRALQVRRVGRHIFLPAISSRGLRPRSSASCWTGRTPWSCSRISGSFPGRRARRTSPATPGRPA